MGILGWIVLGLIAGAIAKLILPGRQGGGWIITIDPRHRRSAPWAASSEASSSTPRWRTSSPFRPGLLAIGGAIIVLLIYGLVTRGRRKV